MELREAASSLPEIVKRAEGGEEIGISRQGREVARLIPLPKDCDLEGNISWEGQIWLSAKAEDATGEMLYASIAPSDDHSGLLAPA